jgi:hypothetical protein
MKLLSCTYEPSGLVGILPACGSTVSLDYSVDTEVALIISMDSMHLDLFGLGTLSYPGTHLRFAARFLKIHGHSPLYRRRVSKMENDSKEKRICRRSRHTDLQRR